MNLAIRGVRQLLPLAFVLLAACNGSVAEKPITDTGDQSGPPVADNPAPPDTTAPAPGRPVPFVNPTKVGRALGGQSPSPPESRTR